MISVDETGMKTMIAVALLFTGCASAPSYYITSNEPARIERAGVIVCETTPCKVNGMFFKNDYGGCVEGAYTELEAYSVNGSRHDQKRVFGGCSDQLNVFFDLEHPHGVQN